MGACAESAAVADDAQRERLREKVDEVARELRSDLLCSVEDVQLWVVGDGCSLMPYG